MNKPALVMLCATASIVSALGTLALDDMGVISLTPSTNVAEIQTQPQTKLPGRVAQPVETPAPAPAQQVAAAMPDAGPRLLQDPVAVREGRMLPPDLPEVRENPDEEPEEDDVAYAVPAPVPAPAPAQPWTVETRPEQNTPSAGTRLAEPYVRRMPVDHSLRDPSLVRRLAQISPGASVRLAAKFRAAKANWQPAEIAMVAIKDDKMLELFARPEGGGEWTFIHRYPVLAASGQSGPKLRQGDKQVPEGLYNISFLNPNSKYHVSLRVNYPNAFDRQMGAEDGRSNLGGDIMIHGKALSVGCLAVGDEAAEELFVLAAETGLRNIKLIIAPTDFRRRSVPTLEAGHPKWLPKLYAEVKTAMADYKSPPPASGLLSFFSN